MSDRSELLSFRPSILSIVKDKMVHSEELFQNETLRPILKYQHQLLLAIFKHHLAERKVNLPKMAIEQRTEWIKNTLQKDTALRNLMIGCVVGHFTQSELWVYLQQEKALRKRIKSLLIQRIQSEFKED